MMKPLTPGTGNQLNNRKIAMEFISTKLLPGSSIEPQSGTLTTPDGDKFHVSAYAESPRAMISTPGVDRSMNSIFASGYECLMYRQLEVRRVVIYRVDPDNIQADEGATSVEWSFVKQASSKYWICKDEIIREICLT